MACKDCGKELRIWEDKTKMCVDCGKGCEED